MQDIPLLVQKCIFCEIERVICVMHISVNKNVCVYALFGLWRSHILDMHLFWTRIFYLVHIFELPIFMKSIIGKSHWRTSCMFLVWTSPFAVYAFFGTRILYLTHFFELGTFMSCIFEKLHVTWTCSFLTMCTPCIFVNNNYVSPAFFWSASSHVQSMHFLSQELCVTHIFLDFRHSSLTFFWTWDIHLLHFFEAALLALVHFFDLLLAMCSLCTF